MEATRLMTWLGFERCIRAGSELAACMLDRLLRLCQANSPFGTLVVEDYQAGSFRPHIIETKVTGGMQQKVGETPLTYQLKATKSCVGCSTLD